MASMPELPDYDQADARRFMELGGILSITTDAHSANDLDLLRFGVATGRRAWLEPRHVINTWETQKLVAWLSTRGK